MSSIPVAPLPQHLTTVQTWSLDSTAELARLRAELATALAESKDEPRSDHAELARGLVLVCSELATNALAHGHPPTVVRLMKDSVYVLDVMDHDPDGVPEIASGRGPGDGGFGLVLAGMIAGDVGWYSAGRTKHVWASFPVHERQQVDASS